MGSLKNQKRIKQLESGGDSLFGEVEEANGSTNGSTNGSANGSANKFSCSNMTEEECIIDLSSINENDK